MTIILLGGMQYITKLQEIVPKIAISIPCKSNFCMLSLPHRSKLDLESFSSNVSDEDLLKACKYRQISTGARRNSTRMKNTLKKKDLETDQKKKKKKCKTKTK